jgi:pimeloyl-ACP methyl ester carboxylesterase
LYETLEVSRYRSRGPSSLNALTEIPRTLLEMSTLLMALPLLRLLPRGDNHTVMVLPGFMAGDESTMVLRGYLSSMGYTALPWLLGRNTGGLEVMQARLRDRFEEACTQSNSPVSLIGQSLGGIYARELARWAPDKVRQVITLGSPFGVTHAGETQSAVKRLFEQQTGMTLAQMRDAITTMELRKTPPIPLTAIYSKGDGIVNWRVCREVDEDHQTQNVEVWGSHCGMGFNPSIYRIIADRLAQSTAQWQKYRS